MESGRTSESDVVQVVQRGLREGERGELVDDAEVWAAVERLLVAPEQEQGGAGG
jgi:predicted transcriptional regulator